MRAAHAIAAKAASVDTVDAAGAAGAGGATGGVFGAADAYVPARALGAAAPASAVAALLAGKYVYLLHARGGTCCRSWLSMMSYLQKLARDSEDTLRFPDELLFE